MAPPSPPRRRRASARLAAAATTTDSEREPNTKLEAAKPAASRARSFAVRTASTLVLVAAFVAVIWAGHVPLSLMILGIQAAMCRELFALARAARAGERAPPRAVALPTAVGEWYFFGVAAFWMYFRFIHKQLAVEVTSTARAARLAAWLLRRHALAAFCLYTAGFVAFVLRLRKGCYLYQFRQYAWTHLTLLFIFFPSSFFVSNIFDGIIWFLLPTSLVIVNDIGAYIAGFFFGRTPLISLSPKKTWEGFVGGLVVTVAASWVLADAASRAPWLTCPRGDLSLGPLACDPGPTFAVTTFSLADALPHEWAAGEAGALAARVAARARTVTFRARPMQLHAVALAAFASLIAPFGGFFASGFKRSAKIKDFGSSIPGHGGVTDRMDCQVVMAVFAYLYVNTFVAPPDPASAATLAAAALALAPLERLALAARLANVAAADGLVGGGVAGALEAAVAAAGGGGEH